MSRKIYTIFMAGGKGLRMGADTPKQFLELGGLTVLQQTILRFSEVLPEMKIVVVLPTNHISTWKSICLESNFSFPQTLVCGGITRFHSVRNALEKVPDGATVMIHDGVRPLVSRELIARLAQMSEDREGIIPVTPVTDTLKALEKAGDGTLVQTERPDPSREGLYGAQTPQVFHSELIKEAYTQAFDQSFTDDASVARRYGIPLTYVEGERYNIKITTPEDLGIARKLFG